MWHKGARFPTRSRNTGVVRVDGETPQQWAKAIKNVLDDERTPTLDEQFSIDSVQKRWEEVYKSLLQ